LNIKADSEEAQTPAAPGLKSRTSKEATEIRFIEAVDMAYRFGARVPDCHEDDPRAALWIERIAELPLAQQQGRLAEAIAEADRYALSQSATS
jgi:hypothetical protein